jgi:PAS domain S-box-containing protein
MRFPLLWMAALFIFLSGAMLALALATMRSQQIESGQRSLDALTRVLEEQTTRSLQTVDARLQLAADDVQHLAQDGRMDEPSLREVLLRHLQDLPFAKSMWVLDARGRMLAGSTGAGAGPDNSDRDYFQALRSQPASPFVVGKPAPGAITRQWRLPAARALRKPDGGFLGVVAAGIAPEYFDASWSSVDLGPDYAVALFRRDATLMMRSPLEPVELGQAFPQVAVFGPPHANLASGHFQKTSVLDGKNRYFAFRVLSMRPDLVLVAGQSSTFILAPWWRVATLAMALWLLASSAIAALTLYLHRARLKQARSEKEAKDLGERLDMATRAAAIGAWDWDLATDSVSTSSGYYTMLGYAPSDLAVDRGAWLERCHPDDRTVADRHIREALEGRVDTYEYEVRLRHFNGEYRWTRLLGRVAERDATHRPIRMVGVRMDVHQHRLAEDALRRSEAFNTTVLDSVNAQIAVLDHHGVILAVNEPWRRFGQGNSLGPEGTALPSQIGVDYLSVCLTGAGANAASDTLVAQAHAGILGVIDRRLPHFALEYACHSPEAQRWFLMQCTPLGDPGGGVVIAHTDITERVTAVDKLRHVMRLYALRTQISRAIIDHRDHAGLLQEICRVAIEFGRFRMAWIGVQSQGTEPDIRCIAHAGHDGGFLGRLFDPASGGITPDLLPATSAATDVATSADIAAEQRLTAWRNAALMAGYRSAATVAFAIDGKPVGTLNLFAAEAGFFTPGESQMLHQIGQDISFAVAAIASETARERAELALHGLLQDKEALLKEVHHRVKNNLQVVSSLLRLEAARDVAPGTRSVLHDMQGRIQTMALLHETLYGSRNFGLVDLSVYLRQLATQAFTTFSTRTGAVSLHLDLVPVEVSMDQAITCGLLVNELVSNGLKHGFPGGINGEIAIELQAQDTAGRLLLRISDNGIGLPANFAQRQTESLGLQLASDLAGQLGGSLQVGPAPAAIFAVAFTADTAA